MHECQCNCGNVTFRIRSISSGIHVCHCSICRRFTGGPGIPVVIVKDGDFEWLGGREHVRTWTKPGADWEANFCGICGSSLPGKNGGPNMFVPAGLLPGDIDLKVMQHIFVASKADWDEIGDSGALYQERPAR